MTDIRDAINPIAADVDAITVFAPSTTEYERYADVDDGTDVLVVARENSVDAENFIELPVDFDDVRDGIRFGVEGGMDQGYFEDGDTIICVASMFSADLDSVTRLRVSESIRTGVYDLFVNSRAEANVIRDVLELVIELGRKGQKGEPVGALFVVGDAGKVMNKSRPLSYNPFEKSHVHVGDSIVNVMLKEFSRLDGAFVISDAGKIVSAYRYLEGSAEGIDIPRGLGTRHMAAAAITRDTNSVSIVLSESDGLVRAFKRGELVLELDPEAY
jgi:DNA integrity scanning protein DisA with diadenylate cyclase activity